MTTGNSEASRASSDNPFGLSSKVGGESWDYVNLSATIFAVTSTLLTGCVMGYLLGLLWGGAWTLASVVMLLAMIAMAKRLSEGDESASTPAIVCNVILVGLWIVGAAAMFMTRDPAAMVAATSMGWTWICHMLIGGQRNRVVMLLVMSMPAAALLYFQIDSSWTSYPFWIAIAATLSSLMTMLVLAKCAEIAHANVERIGAATGAAKAMRSKLEFAIESVGDGYFEIDLETMTYTPNPNFAKSLGFEPNAGCAQPSDLDTCG